MRIALVALLSLVGCATRDGAPASPDGGAQDASDAATPADVQCTAWAATWCANLSRCMPARSRSSFASQDACTSRMAVVCVRVFFGAGTGITADNAGPCLAALAPSDCGVFVRSMVEGTVPDACGRGAGTEGEACGASLQCATGVCVVDSSGCGKCVGSSSVGRACQFDAECMHSEYCNGVCQPRGEIGAACRSTSQCHAELACVSGKCAARPGIGESCADDDTDPCASAPPLACDVATLTCQPLQFTQTGGSCDPSTRTACDYPSSCVGLGTAAKCVLEPDDGAPCTESCRAPASCARGVCQILDPTACEAMPP